MSLAFGLTCDNNADNIKAVIVLAPFVQDIIKERGEHEIDDICKDVVERKMNINMPKKLLRDGQSFDTLTIDTKACKVTITVCKEPSRNRLKVLWT